MLKKIRKALVRLYRRLTFDLTRYWQDRYKGGGTSGAGSYDHLAAFKAEIINGFVRENNVASVVEFGCGDGNQLSLAVYPAYLGLDISATAVDMCKTRFAHHMTKAFRVISSTERPTDKADLALSLDVIFHLKREADYLVHLFNIFSCAEKYVVIYSSNKNERVRQVHMKHHRFTDDVPKVCPKARLIEEIPNRYPMETDSRFFIYGL